MLVVLDSNLLLSALISPHGAPGRIYEAWQDGRFELVTCPLQLEEIRRASRYPKLRAILKPHLVGRMVKSLQRARVLSDFPAVHQAKDHADAYLLDLADFAGADYLLTGDKRSGLLELASVGRARISNAADFVQIVLR